MNVAGHPEHDRKQAAAGRTLEVSYTTARHVRSGMRGSLDSPASDLITYRSRRIPNGIRE